MVPEIVLVAEASEKVAVAPAPAVGVVGVGLVIAVVDAAVVVGAEVPTLDALSAPIVSLKLVEPDAVPSLTNTVFEVLVKTLFPL